MTETKTAEKTEPNKIDPTKAEPTKTAAEADDKPKLFNLTQIAGGALAAITTAAVGSRLGYGGTLAGAGIASVLAALASTLYTKGLERTRDGVKKIVRRDADGEPEPEVELVANAEPAARKARWVRPVAVVGGMVATAGITFVVAMGVVTGWEFGTGKTLDGRTGTTIGQVSNRQTAKPTPSASVKATTKPTVSATPSATETPTAAPSATSTPTATPTPSATSSASSQAPAEADSLPSSND
ncbi:MAG: hypothetical protein QM619_07305 [Micropruina sp.]|uniref:hypothetical protein n=1 Tax=Micropruina sp. TaxID=2737536 RepID=UPI0039E6998A